MLCPYVLNVYIVSACLTCKRERKKRVYPARFAKRVHYIILLFTPIEWICLIFNFFLFNSSSLHTRIRIRWPFTHSTTGLLPLLVILPDRSGAHKINIFAKYYNTHVSKRPQCSLAKNTLLLLLFCWSVFVWTRSE